MFCEFGAQSTQSELMPSVLCPRLSLILKVHTEIYEANYLLFCRQLAFVLIVLF
jgi:hypothetical protein